MFNRLRAVALLPVALFAAVVPSAAFATATGPDFTTLTDAVSFDSASTAILSVGALAIGLAVVVLGIRKIVQMVRGA